MLNQVASYNSQSRSPRDMIDQLEESFGIPKIMDDVLESAISTFDRAAVGFFSGLAATELDFARSDDNSHLIARLHMPNTDSDKAAPRKIHAAVIGRSHLRVTVETQSDGLTTSSTQTVALPAKVSQEGVDISSKADGTVHISLRILTQQEAEKETATKSDPHDNFASHLTFPLNGRFFPPLFERALFGEAGAADFTREIPSPVGIEKCKEKYGKEKLQLSKCLCDATLEMASRAVCYGNLISKAVSMARRLEWYDFATSMKHNAIECANGVDDKVLCLEHVARNIVESLRRGGESTDRNNSLTDRIRQAIESEDGGPPTFQPSYGMIIGRVVLMSVFLLLLLSISVLVMARRRSLNTSAIGAISRLTSVMSQNSGGWDHKKVRLDEARGDLRGPPSVKIDRSSKLA